MHKKNVSNMIWKGQKVFTEVPILVANIFFTIPFTLVSCQVVKEKYDH